MNSKIRGNAGLALAIALFLILYFFHLNTSSDLWWDSSVYLNMGKYIYSSGDSGLYEASRPLVWPLILGLFWKLGLDAVFFGKLMVLLFAVGIMLLTYLIARELFGKKTALISAFLLALTPTFFLFSSIMFSEIPSTFFSVLGVYLFIRKSYSLSGLFFGIAFMARFFQILLIIPFYLFFAYIALKNKALLKQFFASILFFLIPAIPYLIANWALFHNPLYPFFLQGYMTSFTGWVYSQPFWFYFLNIIKENALALFSILGILLIFRREKGIRLIIPIAFLMAFIPYNLIAHKEMRFLIPALPLLSILAAYGIAGFLELVGKFRILGGRSRMHENLVLILIIMIAAFQAVPQLRLNDYDDKLDTFYDFMDVIDANQLEGLWISNPSFIAYSDAKADELIYYPLYNTKKMIELQEKSSEANYVLINTCDILPCPPDEAQCAEEHNTLISLLKNKLNLYFYERLGECEHYIFIPKG